MYGLRDIFFSDSDENETSNELTLKLTIFEEKFECPITLENNIEGYKLKCGHIFSNSILKVKTNKCLLCRKKNILRI
jgi:hypothetical protein